ncbi:DUF1080 domain-containing protein [Fontisphaera persica]|uniref:DUF1080 domain-containing protein n=1 Tax=Fontisphaera persica TaxID=2974023 RepID=UPI0024BF647C|nr:DUF1080 domain-containing protein [Fontisphaera persica]WCJ60348.1 DUF1080 domain-containing protein [Fontisphaera persica]
MNILRLACIRAVPAVAAAVLGLLALPAAEPSAWQSLFDGQTLNGWRASENPASFKVENGAIVADGPRAHLFYVGPEGQATFKNFELEFEAKAGPLANSGVFFHTRFQEKGFPGAGLEVQIHNARHGEGDYRENKLTGSLYGVRNVYKALVADEQWFKMAVRVSGKRVQIRVNDTLVVDYLEPTPPFANPERPGRRLGDGTFALQCHDPKSKVWFRNLRVRRLPDAAPAEDLREMAMTEHDRAVLRLGAANYPVVNYHMHLKGGLTLPEALAESRRSGVFYGVAVNCGVGFGITNDAGIDQFLREMKGQPVFVAMQAEGREWVNMFSPAAVAKFDYVFTDSMTFTDRQGRRMRLWIKEEVGEIPDKQAFMDLLVEKTVEILSREAVDIYVNPTFLPDVLAAEYDTLWTAERMKRVIDAAAAHGVAIEINARYKLPSPAFIKMAKAAGCKFTFGTNNGGREVGDLDYCFQMVRECGLRWQDIWTPRPDGQKPVQRYGKLLR